MSLALPGSHGVPCFMLLFSPEPLLPYSPVQLKKASLDDWGILRI